MTTSWKIQWKGHFTSPRKTFKKKCVRLVEEKLKRLLKDTKEDSKKKCVRFVEEKLKRLLKDTKEDSSKQKDSMFL